MKPVIFKSSEDLTNYISRLPKVEGSVKVQGNDMSAEQILARCSEIAPKIFRYKEVLVKGKGGLGNNKSLQRYAEIIAESAVNEANAQFEMALNAVQDEVEALVNGGVSQEIASALGTARSAIEVHNLCKNIIKKFEAKLNSRMAVVHKSYKSLVSELETLKKRHIKDRELVRVVGASQEEIGKSESEAQSLIESMTLYCDLQVGYASLCASSLVR